MVLGLVAALLICPIGQQSEAGKLVSAMMSRYAKAPTLVGRITLTQSIGGDAGKLTTDVQYERPNLLFIRQTKMTAEPKVWVTSSTGQAISYDEPVDQWPHIGARLAEKQVIDGKAMPIELVYMVASHSLGDRSAPLDLVVANVTFLKKLKDQWASMEMAGKAKIGELEVNHIKGKWRENARVTVSAFYDMYITDAGDLVRYVITQDFLLEQNAGPQRLVSTWDCDLKVDAKPDASVFKIYK